MTEVTPIRVLIIDDHPLIRAATKILLHSCKQFEVIGEAADGHSGIKMALQHTPDIVLTDINMEPLNGIETTKRLRNLLPTLVIIGFSALPYAHEEQKMLDAGAVAVIQKSAGREEICRTVVQLWSEAKSERLRDH